VRTVATAGHVDHGKSTLVLALTGTDPDRFPEEKERGLTIDLGFAFTKLPSGEEVGFVDVPGHVRFIKNMLAGVGAVDVVMLVVAANEGWMPQSEEHLRIIELLGVRHGLVCLTKADLVDDDTLELAQLELDEHLAPSVLVGAPVVVCDALSGRGLDDVRAGLDAVLAAAPEPVDRDRPRLWVDRVFAAKGAGTVVTGTLAGGSLRVDDEVEIGPRARRARIRAIETAHHQLDVATPGTRVALNLAGSGIERTALRRGDGVVRAGQWQLTDVVDVGLEPLREHTFRARSSLQCYVGSGEHSAVLRVLDADGRYGRIRVDERVPLAPGDRLVLRDPGERDTVGGAEVLDAAPHGRARDALAYLALPLEQRLLAGAPGSGRPRRPRSPTTSSGRAPRCVSAGGSSTGTRWQRCEPPPPPRCERTTTAPRSSRAWSWGRWRPSCESTSTDCAPPSRTTASSSSSVATCATQRACPAPPIRPRLAHFSTRSRRRRSRRPSRRQSPRTRLWCAHSRAKAPSSISTGSCSRPARSRRRAGGYRLRSATAGR